VIQIQQQLFPDIRATPSPPNIGSLARSAEPKIIATAVNIIGFALVAVATAIAFFFSIPFSAIRLIAKSTRSSEFLELIPMRAINPIRDVAVRKKVCSVTLSATQCPTITPIRDRNEPMRITPLY